MLPIGIVPAGGLGTRIAPYGGPKELLQVGYETVEFAGTSRIIPRVVGDYVLRLMRGAGITNVYLVLSPHKWELFKFFGDGSHLGLQLAYLCQTEPRSLPHAIQLAIPWTRHDVVVMGMPDTIIEPADCIASLLRFHESRRADLTLGVFPTPFPSLAAPVEVEAGTGRVRAVFDKPETPPFANTWGVAAWNPAFSELLSDFLRTNHDTDAECVLSDAFARAVSVGLEVYAKVFDGGTYRDIGTPDGLLQARADLEGLRGAVVVE